MFFPLYLFTKGFLSTLITMNTGIKQHKLHPMKLFALFFVFTLTYINIGVFTSAMNLMKFNVLYFNISGLVSEIFCVNFYFAS